MRKIDGYLWTVLAVVMFCSSAVNSQTIKPDDLSSSASAKAELSSVAPSVVSITRVDANPSRWYHIVNYIVTFSEPVSGVDFNDFALTTTGDIAQAPPNNPLSLAQVRSVSGSGATYSVAVFTGPWGTLNTKTGTLRLDLIDNDSIVNVGGEFLGGEGAGNGNFTTGEAYDIISKRLLMRLEQTVPSNNLITVGHFADPNLGVPCSAVDDALKSDNLTAPSATLFARLTQHQQTSYFGKTHRFLGQEDGLLMSANNNSTFATWVRMVKPAGISLSRPFGINIQVNHIERISYNTEDDSFFYGIRVVHFPRYQTFHLNFAAGGSLDYTPNGDGTYTWVIAAPNGTVTTFTTIDPEISAPPTLDEPDLLPSHDNGINPCDNVIGFNTNLPFKFFADPDAKIQLLRDGAVVAAGTADANGEGVLTDAGIIPDGAHVYSLRQIVNGSPRDVSYQPTNVIVRSGSPATVTINQAEGQSDPAKTSPVNFTVVFSEPVTDFDWNDVIISGTAVGDFDFQRTVTGSGAVYNVAIGTQNTRRNGTLSVSIPATSVTGTSAVTNLASTSTDNAVNINMPDGDGDSVPNSFDACQTTASGAVINETGCEIRQCVPPLAGLIDWYAGNDNAVDLISNQSGGVGGVYFTQGKIGRTFSFDGGGTVYSAPTAVGLSPMTYMAWIRLGITNAVHHSYYRPRISNVVSTNSPYSNGHGFGADISSGGGGSMVYNINPMFPSGQDAYFDYNFSQGAWYHVAVTYSPLTDAIDPDGAPIKLGSTKVYINGSLVNDTGMTLVKNEVFRNSFRIGGRDPRPVHEDGNVIYNPFEFFKGEIDEVQVYNRELGDYEVRAIALADNYGVCQPTVFAPVVNSVTRDSAQNNLFPNSIVQVAVAFSKPVTGVDASDFTLLTTGSISGAFVANVTGSGSSRIVTINTGTGFGTVRLDVVDDDSIKDSANNPLGGVGTGNGNFTTGEVISILMPTAAAVDVSGLVTDSTDRPVSGVLLQMMDAAGNTITARTNSFGFYRFTEIRVGETYVINLRHKRYNFTPRVVTVIDELTELNFVAENE